MSDLQPSLWRHRDFNLVWLGQTLSWVGSSFTMVAFPLLVYRSTQSLRAMTTVTACLAAGNILAGVVIGPIVDRVDRRRFLLLCDVLRMALLSLVPVVWWTYGAVPSLLYVVALGAGFLENAFNVAYLAFVPELVSKARVTEANARLQASVGGALFVGPAVAGIVVGRWGAPTALVVDALSFVPSLVTLLAVRARPGAPADPSTRPGRLAGIRYILETPVLRTLMILFAVEAFATEGTIDLFTFHVKARLGLTDESVGLMFAVSSLGIVIGALAAPALQRRLGLRGTFVAMGSLLVSVLALAPLTPALWLTALAAVGFVIATTVRGTLSVSRRQAVTPNEMLGRVTASFWLVLAIPRPIGAAVVGVVGTRFGTNAAFASIAGVVGVVVVATAFSKALAAPAAGGGA